MAARNVGTLSRRVGHPKVRSMENPAVPATEQILGLQFFNGAAAEAVATISRNGGLLVAPSGTCFERFLEDADYRRAIMSADVVLPDSGAMVALWRLRTGRLVNRTSGLTYLQALLPRIRLEETLFVLPHERAQKHLHAWSRGDSRSPRNGSGAMGRLSIRHSPSAISSYLAPFYDRVVRDETLLALARSCRPRHIVVAIGAGAQEKLGWYLREHTGYQVSIHCIGGALGFVTGDQVAIPAWADRFYLGWFLRFLSQPRSFLPRLWKARVLPALLWRHGPRLPPMQLHSEARYRRPSVGTP